MIVTFYDSNFKALANNSSLNVSTWSLRRKAIDFDEMTAVAEQFVESINPVFVVLANDKGQYVYGAFSGVPVINSDNQTEINASDLKTILNNELTLDFSLAGSVANVKLFFDFIFNRFNSQNNDGKITVEFDTSNIAGIEYDILSPETETKTYNVWDTVKAYMEFYDIYVESYLDLNNKKIKFTFRKISEAIDSVNLERLGIKNFGKYVAPINTTRVETITESGSVILSKTYVLTSNNVISDNLSDRDLYPIKIKIFDNDADAIAELANNRYNESLEVYLEDARLGQKYSVYEKFNIFYKTLPVGEIYIDSSGKNVVKLGYKADDLILYIGG